MSRPAQFLLAVLVIAAPAALAQNGPARHARVDGELAVDLAGWASRLSGRTVAADARLPAFVPLADDLLATTVCPDQPGGCRGLVAAYDTDRMRIVYRASLDMHDPTDQSFIVHELVHWLQHQAAGEALTEQCQAVLAAEAEAYRVQNDYLQRFRQWQRMGAILRFTFCGDEAAANDAPTVRMDASTGPITATRLAPAASGSTAAR